MLNRDEDGYRDIDPALAEQLVREGNVCPVDVRTPQEFEHLGHIPGATLLPVDLISVAPATLRQEPRPLLVYCEHGIRSAHAARFLVQAGFEKVMNMVGGMSGWRGPRDHTPGDPFGESGVSSWLVTNQDLLLKGGSALDVACGTGRHALLLAAAGFTIRAVDRDPDPIVSLRAVAKRLDLPIRAEVLELESASVDLGDQIHDLIVVIHYLYRPLFPSLFRALRPGGLLLYETFTVHQAARGKPRNPAFLLQPGELRRLVAPLRILRDREGEHEGRMVSAVAARKATD